MNKDQLYSRCVVLLTDSREELSKILEELTDAKHRVSDLEEVKNKQLSDELINAENKICDLQQDIREIKSEFNKLKETTELLETEVFDLQAEIHTIKFPLG